VIRLERAAVPIHALTGPLTATQNRYFVMVVTMRAPQRLALRRFLGEVVL
jgi:hypothetical protein